MVYHALKVSGRMSFICVAKNETQFKEKYNKAYWTWRGQQPKYANAHPDELQKRFMQGFTKVKLTVEVIK